jgi:hypothetical protein
LSAELSVESSVRMLDLGLSEDSLHDDDKFMFIEHELGLAFIVAILVFGSTIPEEKFSEFSLLFLIVVRGELIEPQTHSLGVVLLNFGSLQVSLGCFP